MVMQVRNDYLEMTDLINKQSACIEELNALIDRYLRWLDRTDDEEKDVEFDVLVRQMRQAREEMECQ